MSSNGIDSYDALLGMFIQRADAIAVKLNAVPLHWDEVFTAGAKVADNAIFQVWSSSSAISSITAAQYSVIASPSSYWYLDHADSTWSVMYAYDPAVGLTESQQAYLIGGEAAMWGEMVDENNIESVVFPRLCAVAERLWSPAAVADQADALARLTMHRCRLVRRGVRAAPVQPGFCTGEYL
jgi:hexosaminidase